MSERAELLAAIKAKAVVRGDFVLLLRGGTTAESSQGYRDKVRAHLVKLTFGRN